MERYQRGGAGIIILAVIVVMLGGCMWHDGWHDGNPGGHMSGWQRVDRQEKSALELLDEAYARGEINREEYLQRRTDLLNH